MPETILRRVKNRAVPTPIPLLQAPVLPTLPALASRKKEPEPVSSIEYEVGDPTALPTPTTRWVREFRAARAFRSDGIKLWFHEAGWQATLPAGESVFYTFPSEVSDMEACISALDAKFPPAPWVLEGGVWKASVWRVITSDGLTWGVWREIDGKLTAASRQPFTTADRARRWAELRFDRGSAGLRGPKPRAGARSKAKLPDVRVTEDERTRMQATLEQVGMSYSEMVRASAYWVEENLLGPDAPWAVERLDNGVVRFARTKA